MICRYVFANTWPCALRVVNEEGAGSEEERGKPYVRWHVCPSGIRIAATPQKDDTAGRRPRWMALYMTHLVT
jgi:hypothetical protein